MKCFLLFVNPRRSELLCTNRTYPRVGVIKYTFVNKRITKSDQFVEPYKMIDESLKINDEHPFIRRAAPKPLNNLQGTKTPAAPERRAPGAPATIPNI